jgi:transposase InsO family protein
VPEEVIRLKALMPEAGCRLVAATFNRRLGPTRGETVGKSYVAELLRRRAYEVQVLRRRIKNRRPREVPKNLVWGVDLTTHRDASGTSRHVLAVVDHASRAALALEALADKSRRTVLLTLMRTFQLYGPPKFIRTDNERIFSGFGFRLTLFLLGIHHRPTEIGCPWQNASSVCSAR